MTHQFVHKVQPLFEKNDVVFVALFGSQAKKTANSKSDYDFLVEFSPQKKYTLLDISKLKRALEKALAKAVDVVTTKGLHRYIKDEVLRTSVTIYDHR